MAAQFCVRPIMGYRIEYLTETTEENSVVHTFMSKGATLEAAEADAMDRADEAREKGATGFQIRHLNAVDVVVAIAEFPDPSLN